MPPTLRKRPAPEPPAAAPAPPAKKKGTVAKAVAKVKQTVKQTVKQPQQKAAAANSKVVKEPAAPPAPKENGSKAAAPSKVAVGETIDLEGFGGDIETNDGEKTTLKKLVDDSKSGVVLFTYPKASTPGCTTQVCLFRDSYTPLSETGYSIFGLSKDSPKANTNFKTKQKLPYALLCDTSASLIGAIGLKKGTSTTRGIFVIDKSGKVLAAEPGSPKGTLEVVEKLIGGSAPEEAVETAEKEEAKAEETTEEKAEEKTEEAAAPETNGVNGTNGASKEDVAQADVAADVADTAEKLDSNEEKSAEA